MLGKQISGSFATTCYRRVVWEYVAARVFVASGGVDMLLMIGEAYYDGTTDGMLVDTVMQELDSRIIRFQGRSNNFHS